MRSFIGLILFGVFLFEGPEVAACSKHPGVTHEQYVISIRKRKKNKPVVKDTYSTSFGDEQPPTSDPGSADAPALDQPQSQDAEPSTLSGDDFFKSIGK